MLVRPKSPGMGLCSGRLKGECTGQDDQLGHLSHRTHQHVHFLATSCPSREHSKYTNAVCLEQVDLPGHMLESFCKLADHYSFKIDKAKLAWGGKGEGQ